MTTDLQLVTPTPSAVTASRIVIIEEHQIVSEGIAALLAGAGIKVVGQATNAEDGMRMVARLLPDVVLMEVQLPGINGVQAANRIARKSPRVKIVMLSAWDDEAYVLESLLSANASAYVLKSDDFSSLLLAIKAAVSGKRYISPSITGRILKRLRSLASSKLTNKNPLSRREREIVKLIAEGGSAKKIAGQLGISPKTVQTHRANLAAKLGLRSTASIVRYAIKTQLVIV